MRAGAGATVTIAALELAGVLGACVAAAAGLVLRGAAARYAAVGLALVASLALIAGEVWDQERFAELRDQPGVLALAVLLAGMAVGAAAATFVRAPAAFAIAVFAVLPLRLPLRVGDETNFLLVPLYGVIAGAWVRAVWLIYRGRSDELRPSSAIDPGDGLARWLGWALAALLVLYGVASAWSDDPANAIRNVAFFLAPFAALFVLLRDLRWYRKLVGQVLLATVLMALAFAAIGYWQYASRDLLLNDDLQEANDLHLYFRVNSLFVDPNVLGRYLALAIVALAAWFAWWRPRAQAIGGFAVAVALLGALAVTFSLTSFASLVVALAVLAWLRLGGRGLAAGAALLVVGVAALVLWGAPPDEQIGREKDLAEVSSGRTGLISGGLELFERAPLAGQGSGAFGVEFRRQVDPVREPVSHTEPVTVAAEQGIIGLVPYLALLAIALALLLRPWPGRLPERAGVAACFVALLVHSLGYAGFTIDPATWALLALGVALRE